MVNKELPHSCTLINVAKELNTQCIIHSTPGRLQGVQQSLKEQVEKRIKHLAETNPRYV